jgi:hypothetical protein
MTVIAADARSKAASRVVRGLGIVLLAVAGIHLAVTPLLAGFLAGQMPAAAWQVTGPPMMLNHVVVGILLVPVGVTLIGLGPQLRARSPWAWRIATVHAVAIAGLPVALVAIMPPSMFAAPAFAVAAALVAITAIVLPAVLIWARRAANPA